MRKIRKTIIDEGRSAGVGLALPSATLSAFFSSFSGEVYAVKPTTALCAVFAR